jgi:hypothetical protein
MSTRSMTLVQQSYSGPDAFIPLYRHCDGYPAEAGAAIVEALNSLTAEKDGSRLSGACEAIVSRLLKGDIGEYRLANWMPNDQGDLEHVYWIFREINNGSWSNWKIRHAARAGWVESQKTVDDWPTATYSLAEFVAFVNLERQQMNKRIAQLRATSKHYADCEDYPMLEVRP